MIANRRLKEDSMALPLQLPVPRLSDADRLELEASIARHPAGKRRVIDLSVCPTCNHKVSGAIGSPAQLV